MITKRLINCDFFTKGNISTKCSNKAKLLYFYFIVNADDMGFVGNGKEIAETLDRCEENFENTLFQFTYVNAIEELVEKRLVLCFQDKIGSNIYLIKHWFLHNKYQSFLTTNYNSLLDMVEIVKNEYQWKTLREETIIKENKIKEKQIKSNLKSNSLKDYDNDIDNNQDTNINSYWDKLMDEIDEEDKEEGKNKQ